MEGRLTIAGTIASVKGSDQGYVLTLAYQDRKGETRKVDIECPSSITIDKVQEGQQVIVTLTDLQARWSIRASGIRIRSI
jgi:hypothetical protein